MAAMATQPDLGFEVPEPILNGPYDEPANHWLLREGEPPKKEQGRRSAGYWYRDPRSGRDDAGSSRGVWRELALANLIRARMAEWRKEGYPGATRTTAELLAWWDREGRSPRLFFAQREAVETVIFLTEARPDFLQGISIPADEPSDERKAEGYAGFRRMGAKMATGSGKSTVAGMLAAWSILNKVADRSDARFSDTVLIVCPNVTIRSRLNELDPTQGDASLYRTRDLVPEGMMSDLAKGRVVITNWHVFEPQAPGGGGGNRVVRAGKEETRTEWVVIAGKKTTYRGSRYFTPETYDAAVASGTLDVLKEDRDDDDNLVKALVRSTRYVESDTALVARVLGRAGGKQNILVINDEAHHAYRIPPVEEDEEEDEEGAFDFGDEDEEEEEADRNEATVWINGLDKIAKVRGINLCVDLTATPYYLGRMGKKANTVFPWVVSDFGLTDAIECGLVKVPQLVARDPTGADLASYFNIWAWILPRLTAQERGTKRGSPKPEAILKWANHPITILGGMWERLRQEWSQSDDPRPPVYILVCKNKRIAKTLYDWMGDDVRPPGIPSLNIPELKNRRGQTVTIRVDTGVVHETDSGQAKSDENAWMRFTLDTVGRQAWPQDRQGRPIYPVGFEELAAKLERPLHPPGRDVRCIVSVGMLTEGWDCNTVTHIVGLRPFQSQLLCEQVVGRALRRRSYDLGADGKFEEEVAQVFGVPFEVVPFKHSGAPPSPKPPQRRIYAVPQKAQYRIVAPRVLGYSIGVRNRVHVPDWDKVARLQLNPFEIPPESQVAAALIHRRPSIHAPGGPEKVSLEEFRKMHRVQELCFQASADITKLYVNQPRCEAPAHVLFPQILPIVRRYLEEKVDPMAPTQRLDAFLSPYYGWLIERIVAAIQPDVGAGEAPEVPDIDRDRPCDTAHVSVFTSKPVSEVIRSHLNYAVNDTGTWEQSATYLIDSHPVTAAVVKNHGLNFAIPYLHNGKPSEYLPDYLIRLVGEGERYLIAELKGADWDRTAEIKAQAAHRWCAAVNATGQFGHWDYYLAMGRHELVEHLNERAMASGIAVPG